MAGLHGPLLRPTDLRARSSRVTLVAGDPGHSHVALALALGGRVPLSGGSVTLDGVPDPALRRRHVSLVDVPEVTAPEDSVSVRSAVAEQLALAGRPSGRAVTRALLTARGAQGYAAQRFEALPPAERTTVLMAVAASRAETRVLVVGAPDRFGGDPQVWWRLAHDLARDGLTVVVQCTHATARALGEPAAYELGVCA